MADERLLLLTFSTLFPDSTRPNFGVFVENRLRHLVHASMAADGVIHALVFRRRSSVTRPRHQAPCDRQRRCRQQRLDHRCSDERSKTQLDCG